jgi:hypothetical protein
VLKQCDIFFDECLDSESVEDWRNIITACVNSIPQKALDVVPSFFVYNTMVQCLYHTFDPTHPMIDKLNDQFSTEKVWSFSFLQNPNLRNAGEISEDNFRRIVVASSRNSLTPDLAPEMVILHEIGHFVMFDVYNMPYTTTNKKEIENKCDIYAVHTYAQMLVKNSDYTSMSNDPAVSNFEERLREIIATLKENGETTEQISIIIREKLKEKIGWYL